MIFRKIEKIIIKIDPVLMILSANERSHMYAPCTRVLQIHISYQRYDDVRTATAGAVWAALGSCKLVAFIPSRVAALVLTNVTSSCVGAVT